VKSDPKVIIYRVCHWFRFLLADFLGRFWPLLNLALFLEDSWDSMENWLEPKTKPPSGNLACPNTWNALYLNFTRVRSNSLKHSVFRARVTKIYRGAFSTIGESGRVKTFEAEIFIIRSFSIERDYSNWYWWDEMRPNARHKPQRHSTKSASKSIKAK